MESITMYSTAWCPDCRRAKAFLKERGIAFEDANIVDDPAAEVTVIRVNHGKREVPTLKVGGALFCVQPVQRAATRQRIEDSSAILNTAIPLASLSLELLFCFSSLAVSRFKKSLGPANCPRAKLVCQAACPDFCNVQGLIQEDDVGIGAHAQETLLVFDAE